MGIFNTYSDVKCGDQKITPNFLKKMGFKKLQNWGSPQNWNKPENVFWEKLLYVRKNDKEFYNHGATLLYFPPEFDGYVTGYNMQGVPPKNKLMGWLNSASSEDLKGDAYCKMDIYCAIDALTNRIINCEE